MKRLAMPFLLALLSASMAAPGCAGKLPDIWPALKACGTSDVSWGAATEVFGDLVEIVGGNPAGETDLLALLASDVGGGIPCLVNYFESQGGSTGAAATKFKAAHAKELKAAAARGPSACRSSTPAKVSKSAGEASTFRPSGEVVGGLGKLSYAYPGETVAAAADRCEAACGSESSLSSPGRDCQCWHVDKTNWRNSRWVSAPTSLAVAAR